MIREGISSYKQNKTDAVSRVLEDQKMHGQNLTGSESKNHMIKTT